jgi:hypothetical protein
MPCKAPARIGQLLIKPQTAIGTPATFVPAEDGVRVSSAPEWAAIGEGRVDIEETERAIPGGFDPVLGSYGETLSFRIPVSIPAVGELTAGHPMVRLLRACGCGVSIAAGVATITSLVGGCVGDGAGERVPLTVRWEQQNGLTSVWQDCIGEFTIIGENTGGILEIEVTLHCRLVSRAKTTALTASVEYPGQARMLTARNAPLTLGSTTNPNTLYSWTFNPGITAEEVPSQIPAAGLDLPFVYQSSPATFTLNTALEGDYSADLWGHFLAMTTTGALDYQCSGQASGVVLRIQAPRPFASPQSLGVESGHRTDERELLLKPTAADAAAWTITLTERAP